MTIKELAQVQAAGIDIKVVENAEGTVTEKASFNSSYYSIITEEFLTQEIATMTVRKTNGNSMYIELTTVPADDSGDDTGLDTNGDSGNEDA